MVNITPRIQQKIDDIVDYLPSQRSKNAFLNALAKAFSMIISHPDIGNTRLLEQDLIDEGVQHINFAKGNYYIFYKIDKSTGDIDIIRVQSCKMDVPKKI